MLVLDASILIKLFHEEIDSPVARAAGEEAGEHRISLLSPSIALYEILSVALHHELPFEMPLQLIAALQRTGFQLVEPTPQELLKAEIIATTKSTSPGYPQLQDSVYHAMAILRGATFLTADRKHADRTRRFGSIKLLSEWRSESPTPPRP